MLDMTLNKRISGIIFCNYFYELYYDRVGLKLDQHPCLKLVLEFCDSNYD